MTQTITLAYFQHELFFTWAKRLEKSGQWELRKQAVSSPSPICTEKDPSGNTDKEECIPADPQWRGVLGHMGLLFPQVEGGEEGNSNGIEFRQESCPAHSPQDKGQKR